MSNLTYTSGRPAGNISPAAQRSDLQTNNDNNALIWDIDHYGFNNNNGGTHQFVRMPNNVALPGMTGLASGIDTTPGSANAAASQAIFKNSDASFPISAIRAFGLFQSGALLNSYNIASITGTNPYVLTLNANATTTNNAIVIINLSPTQTVSYTFVSNVLTITLQPFSTALVNFIVMQF